MKKVLFVFSLLCLSLFSFGQSAGTFKYQGVARDANQQPYVNTALGLQLSIVLDNGSGTGAGVVQYVERHLTFTSPVGVFSLEIGSGETTFGDWAEIEWGSGSYWLKVEMDVEGGDDYVYMGNSPILSVPLAMHAQTVTDKDDADADPENELQTISFNPQTNQLTISAGNTINIPAGNADADPNPENELQSLELNGLTLSITDGNQVNLAGVQDGTEDADADPQNELQTISFDPQTNELTISEGNTISIPSGSADADADPENELQTISFDPQTNELSISGGNTINIPAGNADADPDPENELQDLQLNGLILSIEDGNEVNLAAIQDGTEDADADAQNELQNLQLNGLSLSITDGNQVNLASIQDGTEDADADPQNELQTISFDPQTNELTISEGNTISIPAGSADADADPENELQNLVLDGLNLSIEGGNEVNLAAVQDGTEDADADPVNELQNLQLNGLVLSISDGNSVDLSAVQDGTADADADPQNEIQTLDFDPASRMLTLTDGGEVDLSVLEGDGTDDQLLQLNGNILTIENGNAVDLASIQDGTEDADADPANELQNLQLNGLNLSISEGNEVNLALVQDGTQDADADPFNELQNLVFDENTNELSILSGNTISLPYNPDDNDANPFNELQTLSLNGNFLSLSNGNQVDLGSLGGSSLWTQTPGHLKTLDNVIIGLDQNANVLSTLEVKDDITIRRSNGAAYVDMFGASNGGNMIIYRGNATGGSNDISLNLSSTPSGGYIDLRNTDSGIRSILEVNGSGGVDFSMTYPDGDPGFDLNTFSSTAVFSMMQPDGDDGVLLGSSGFGGLVTMYGAGGDVVADIGRNASNTDSGKMRLYDDSGHNAIDATAADGGQIWVSASNNDNVYIGTVDGTTTLGKVAVYDSFNDESAGLTTNGFGQGILFADVKNFRMDHPLEDDKEIWYACVEGPEAAAYERGTAQLVNGEAEIQFPAHFELVANHETMTVMLTPLSADCKGLAVVEKTARGFKVKELFQGSGTYAFDWEVKCVRNGYEDYRVIRDKKERL